MCMCVKMWIRNEFVVFLLNLFVTVKKFSTVRLRTFFAKTKPKTKPHNKSANHMAATL